MKNDKFWTETPSEKGKNLLIEIDKAKLLDFCSSNLGYYNYIYRDSYYLVQITNSSIIKEACLEDLKQSLKHYLRVVMKRDDVWRKFLEREFFPPNFIHYLKMVDSLEFNISTKDEAHFFYANGVVRVSSAGRPTVDLYETYKGYAWRAQVNSRNFNFDEHFRDGKFYRFLLNLAANDDNRFQSLLTSLGYILHPYKNPSFAKALILLDEKLDFSGEAHGGTGKSLVARAVKEITATSWKDGKKHNSNDIFALDDIRPYHRVLCFDDVHSNFTLEEFYSFITSEVQIKQKFKDSISIPFSLAPKLLLTSNHMVKGTGGSTDERRRIEVEVAPYYSLNLTPHREFGHAFFDDWDEFEWAKFDTLMLYCVHLYLQHGVIETKPVNLLENKLKSYTNPDFVDFMDENHALDEKLDKTKLLNDFAQSYHEWKHTSGKTFKRWIDIWCNHRGLSANHSKSSGKAIVVLTLKKDL